MLTSKWIIFPVVNLAYSQDIQSQNDHEKSKNSLMPALFHGYCKFAMHHGKSIFVGLLFDDLESGKRNFCFFKKKIWKESQICKYPDVLRAVVREQLYLTWRSGLVLSGDFLIMNGCSMMKCEPGWGSGESTCLPLMWPGQFKFQHGHVRWVFC